MGHRGTSVAHSSQSKRRRRGSGKRPKLSIVGAVVDLTDDARLIEPVRPPPIPRREKWMHWSEERIDLDAIIADLARREGTPPIPTLVLVSPIPRPTWMHAAMMAMCALLLGIILGVAMVGG